MGTTGRHATTVRGGAIAGAGLDVFEVEPLDPASPLLTLDTIVLSPHIAGTTLDTPVYWRISTVVNHLSIPLNM